MASKPETTFYTGVHRHLPPVGEFYREKMYNPLRGGTWDFWFSGKRDLWVEYKYLTLPKRDTTMIALDLSPLQTLWGAGRYAEGRNLAVVVGCKEGGVVFTDLAWEQAISTADFKRKICSRAELAQWIVSNTGGL